MSTQSESTQNVHTNPSPDYGPPFYVSPEEELKLRIQADKIVPSPVIAPATSFDDFVRQLMIPTIVMELARKTSSIHFAAWETEAIRTSLERGILKSILEKKQKADTSHPPYIRVACTGKGDYDDDVLKEYSSLAVPTEDEHKGDFGSAVVLEIWPAGHYSPMHSHGETKGIVYCLTGQIEAMAYKELKWEADKLALMTLTAGQCAWLTDTQFAVHKVYCPMKEGNFAASFHVYLNEDEWPLLKAAKDHTRDVFEYIHETTHKKEKFTTYSDLSWRILRKEMAKFAAEENMKFL